MLRIDPEEGDEDGEVKPVKLKIDQNLFTYSNAKGLNSSIPSNDQMSVLTTPFNPAVNMNIGINMNQQPQYAVVSNSPIKVNYD